MQVGGARERYLARKNKTPAKSWKRDGDGEFLVLGDFSVDKSKCDKNIRSFGTKIDIGMIIQHQAPQIHTIRGTTCNLLTRISSWTSGPSCSTCAIFHYHFQHKQLAHAFTENSNFFKHVAPGHDCHCCHCAAPISNRSYASMCCSPCCTLEVWARLVLPNVCGTDNERLEFPSKEEP